jgi:hypothetical protein
MSDVPVSTSASHRIDFDESVALSILTELIMRPIFGWFQQAVCGIESDRSEQFIFLYALYSCTRIVPEIRQLVSVCVNRRHDRVTVQRFAAPERLANPGRLRGRKTKEIRKIREANLADPEHLRPHGADLRHRQCSLGFAQRRIKNLHGRLGLFGGHHQGGTQADRAFAAAQEHKSL